MRTSCPEWCLGALALACAASPARALLSRQPAGLAGSPGSRWRERQGSAQDIEPIYYMHVPKAGGTIENVIAHFVCNSSFPRKTVNLCLQGFPHRCGSQHFSRFGCERGHPPMDGNAMIGKAVVMFRDPRARTLSGYFHKLHDCERMWPLLNFGRGASWAGQYTWSNGVIHGRILREYKRCVDGCMAKMLTGAECGKAMNVTEVRARVQEGAKKVNGLGFVGLTEHWGLTVCLWHAMFGGDCDPFEFNNTRPGNLNNGSDATAYNESHLSFFDNMTLLDQPIYDEAKRVFQERLTYYGVTPEVCATEICPKAAHWFVHAGPSVAERLRSNRLRQRKKIRILA